MLLVYIACEITTNIPCIIWENKKMNEKKKMKFIFFCVWIDGSATVAAAAAATNNLLNARKNVSKMTSQHPSVPTIREIPTTTPAAVTNTNSNNNNNNHHTNHYNAQNHTMTNSNHHHSHHNNHHYHQPHYRSKTGIFFSFFSFLLFYFYFAILFYFLFVISFFVW